ncbi:MAG: hypothetical protein AAGC85_07755 [Bacteroidota bacterium]
MNSTPVLSYSFLKKPAFLVLMFSSLSLTAQQSMCDDGTEVFTRPAQNLRKGETIDLKIEAGSLTIVEIKIKERKGGIVIPSESYYFSFAPLHPRLYKKYLQKREIEKSIKEALLEECPSKHDQS